MINTIQLKTETYDEIENLLAMVTCDIDYDVERGEHFTTITVAQAQFDTLTCELDAMEAQYD